MKFPLKAVARIRPAGWIAIAACIIVAVALYYILSRPKPQAVELPVVAVQPVEKDDVNIYAEFAGRIRAQQFVEVHARVEGYLQSMNFREGSYVEKGDLLFTIDPTVY
ncbi:MAG: biotin/lipoyl-binding protein, partial [Muribaculaceae bacterium]|nr:biotin/lipoyl-binding protein [Muribaculaceae bacterium]